MKKICFVLILISSVAFSQDRTLNEWKTAADNYLNGNSSEGAHSKGDQVYDAALLSYSHLDMYFEGTGILWGLYRMWQATGQFSYLDKALALLEKDIQNSVITEDYYEQFPERTIDGYWTPKMPFRSNVQTPNYYAEKYGYTYPNDGSFSYWFRPLDEYIRNGQDFSYNYLAAQFPQYNYSSAALGETIYYRFAADLLRVMNHNSEILSLTSSNGKTYQERFNTVKEHIEIHIWTKWYEYESNPRHKEWYVYRENTHMASHLASIAVSLYSITNNQKYLDAVEEYLYDFGSHPAAKNIPAGIGFMDQIGRDEGDALVWSSQWGKRAVQGEANAQDIAHAGPEVAFLVQCYEEGIGLNPPANHLPIDQSFINSLVKTLKQNVIIGDPISADDITYRIDAGGNRWSQEAQMGHGFHVLAQYDRELLAFLENNVIRGDMKMGFYGHGAYAAAVHRVGSEGPAYPSLGNGTSSGTNNCPSIVLRTERSLIIEQGAAYTEAGASWNDIEDGSGEATVGGDTVDTDFIGTYTVTYSYTDNGGCTSTDSVIIQVVALDNNCPVINLNGSSVIVLDQGATYSEEGAVWIDEEDGEGSAEISGDVVDTSTPGTYTVIYSYTDTSGCTSQETRSVRVNSDNEDFIFIESLSWDEEEATMLVGETGLPSFSFSPANATITFMWIQSSDETIAQVDPNGALIALQAGVITVTATTLDGTNLSDTIEVTIIDPNSENIDMESFNWAENTAVMYVGQVGLPSYEANPSNASIPFIWVQSLNTELATVTPNGEIQALNPGVLGIRGTTIDGTYLSDEMTVVILPAPLELNFESNITLIEGQQEVITIQLNQDIPASIGLNLEVSNISTQSSDFEVNAPTTLSFAAGQRSQSFTVSAVADGETEESESFRITLSIPGSTKFENYTQDLVINILDRESENSSGSNSPSIPLVMAPNPARSGQPISISNVQSGDYGLNVYSLSGASIYQANVRVDDLSIETILNLPQMNQGYYILRLTSLEKDYVGKLIVN